MNFKKCFRLEKMSLHDYVWECYLLHNYHKLVMCTFIYFFFFLQIRISSTVFLMVFASHFTHGQPRGFGDNYLSADFGHLDNDAEFDSVDFMPQFDFDGFFKKVDADERSG